MKRASRSRRSSAARSTADTVRPRALSRSASLRALWREPRFPALLATRLTSQASDGLYQTSLAGAVLFNPEHHTGAVKVAAGFVVLLLPYSLIGPFAGVFLDRWRRQRVLFYGAAVRSGFVVATAALLVTSGPSGWLFAVTALVALGVNRFYLAALSAALPSVVAEPRLVLANAISPTAGTVAAIAGGGVGLGLRAAGGSGDHGDAVVALAAAVGYAVAALVSTRLPADSLGPHPPSTVPLREQLAGTVAGLVAGARHIRERPVAAHALGVIFAQRVVFGVWSIMALLLYRNSFQDDGLLRAGLVGVGQAVTLAGVGLVTAAAVTPWVAARIGRRRWIVVVTAAAAVTVFGFGAPFTMVPLLASSLALGFATQATKVCVDTLVQTAVDDDFRGRAFAFYDTTFNLSFVGGALVAALVLPSSGRSLPTLAVMSAAYLLIAVGYGWAERASVAQQPADQPA
jgi:MFS family permease